MSVCVCVFVAGLGVKVGFHVDLKEEQYFNNL